MRHFKSILALFFISSSAFAADLTATFKKEYSQRFALSADEQLVLKKFDIYLVPGIMSESFLSNDDRSKISFSWITGDYFGDQKEVLSKKYSLSVKRLSSSSRSVDEIKRGIQEALNSSRQANRKALFMTHSLGGLALLDELVSHTEEQDVVGGIIFLQSPFYGSPVADVYFEKPYYFDELLKPILPFVNASAETVLYLRTSDRSSFMSQEQQAIANLISKIPLFTLSGVANDANSLFAPAIELMSHGCPVVIWGQCASPKLFLGPYDQSDGMVPLKSSFLPGADSIVLTGVDHGETVVKIPFSDYDRSRMTEVLFKMLVAKMQRQSF
jgi:hypothetical protein